MDIFVMVVAAGCCFIGYWLALDNPLDFDTLDAHVLLSAIISVGCAMATMGLYVLSL